MTTATQPLTMLRNAEAELAGKVHEAAGAAAAVGTHTLPQAMAALREAVHGAQHRLARQAAEYRNLMAELAEMMQSAAAALAADLAALAGTPVPDEPIVLPPVEEPEAPPAPPQPTWAEGQELREAVAIAVGERFSLEGREGMTRANHALGAALSPPPNGRKRRAKR